MESKVDIIFVEKEDNRIPGCKVINIVNQKVGTKKTTIIVNMGVHASARK